MTEVSRLDSVPPGTQDSQFAQLEDRLVATYGPDRRDILHTLITQERDRFAHARVHAFVPILVERSVRSRLSS